MRQPVGTVDALFVGPLHAQNLFLDGICLHFAPCSLRSKCQSNRYSPVACYLFFYLLEGMCHSDSTIVSQTLAMVAVPAWYNMPRQWTVKRPCDWDGVEGPFLLLCF